MNAVLDCMAQMPNYNRAVFEALQPHLQGNILEVGAGVGTFSRLILATPGPGMTCMEPDADRYAVLRRALMLHNITSGVGRWAGCCRHWTPLEGVRFNTILYVNVLEHIGDDDNELAIAAAHLAPGGKIVLFLPADPGLFNNKDRRLGHRRRYDIASVVNITPKDFSIALSHFDYVGRWVWRHGGDFAPWKVRLYDRVFPILRRLEKRLKPSTGKNFVVVMEK